MVMTRVYPSENMSKSAACNEPVLSLETNFVSRIMAVEWSGSIRRDDPEP